MSNEIGANPWQGYQDAEIAEHLAEAMRDLPQDFSDLLDEIKKHAGDEASDAYEAFKDDLLCEIEQVQENGLSLASEVQEGAGDIDLSDSQGSESYEGAWSNIPEPRY